MWKLVHPSFEKFSAYSLLFINRMIIEDRYTLQKYNAVILVGSNRKKHCRNTINTTQIRGEV